MNTNRTDVNFSFTKLCARQGLLKKFRGDDIIHG